jgi:hypothetical protein
MLRRASCLWLAAVLPSTHLSPSWGRRSHICNCKSDFLTLSLIGRLDRLEYSVSHGEYLFFLKSLCDESVEMLVKWHMDKVQSHSL